MYKVYTRVQDTSKQGKGGICMNNGLCMQLLTKSDLDIH